MEREYKTKELSAVWEALSKAYVEEKAGCKAADVAAAAGFPEDVVRACLEYLRQTGKVERAGELYVPAGESNAPKAAVEMTSRRYGTRSPVAMPGGELRFSRQGASDISEEDKEAVYRALVEACRENARHSKDGKASATLGEVVLKARSVGGMEKVRRILVALYDDNKVDRYISKVRGGVEVWKPQ
ncbi:MAG: FaeA/PapI family transcriptional regulator [Candidatus Zixiibacteriota bacterium]|jgi:hypothetical protein